MKLLDGKSAFVTGGSRGIGRAICAAFAHEGCNVAFSFRSNDDAAAKVVQEIEDAGVQCLSFKGAVDDLEAMKAMFKQTAKSFGGLDILVNNAGIKRDGLFMMMSEDNWNDVISTNLKGVFYCCREAAKLMMRKKRGAMVNLTSLTGVMGQPGQANYAASKGGVIAFTKATAKELASYGIRVNGVAPGFVSTDMLEDVPDDVLNSNKHLIPLGRFAASEEIASTVLFLASDMSAYITGEIINVNGGLYM